MSKEKHYVISMAIENDCDCEYNLKGDDRYRFSGGQRTFVASAENIQDMLDKVIGDGKYYTNEPSKDTIADQYRLDQLLSRDPHGRSLAIYEISEAILSDDVSSALRKVRERRDEWAKKETSRIEKEKRRELYFELKEEFENEEKEKETQDA